MNTEYKGIDYGMGRSNIDKDTGIRYGVIPAHDVGQEWWDSSEANYGKPTCPECGRDACDIGDCEREDLAQHKHCDNEYGCDNCGIYFDSEYAYSDEPHSFFIDDGEYSAEQGGDDCDIFIMKAPYYTRAQFCSPCAPGACYLRNPCATGDKAYCFGHEWFEDGRAPYTVFRVSDDSVVEPEAR